MAGITLRTSQLEMRCDNLHAALKNMEDISDKVYVNIQDRQPYDTPLSFNDPC